MNDHDNMRIWSKVCETNPTDTKKVDFGRTFTAIDAYSQIRKATEVFGPIGEGWGWTRIFEDRVVLETEILLCHVELWYLGKDGEKCFVDSTGSANLVFKNKPDIDAHKKAMTDGITKALSYLGFNADVFLGRFDDNKYVAEQREKHKESEGDGEGEKGRGPSEDKTHGPPEGKPPGAPPLPDKNAVKKVYNDILEHAKAKGISKEDLNILLGIKAADAKFANLPAEVGMGHWPTVPMKLWNDWYNEREQWVKPLGKQEEK